jgi:DNA recombination protein RmuC
MELVIAPLLLVIGLAVGGIGAWWLRGREIAAERERYQREVAGLTGLRGEIEQNLKSLAADALQGSQNSFLALANEAFVRHKEGAETSLAQRQRAIEALLAPINASLDEYRKGIAEIEKSRVAAYSGLATEVQGLARM